MNKFISTHYLTQRQTIRGRKKSGIRKFQLTTSRRGRLVNGEQETLALSISTHYLTQRQTKITHYYPEKQLYFNSLPHAEVDAATDGRSSICTLFQLTTSRRGRRRSEKEVELREHFNSLPHAEVDQIIEDSANYQFISTHYLTQRQTHGIRKVCDLCRYFNSLPHAEVDNPIALLNPFCTNISTHYLTQRQTGSGQFLDSDRFISTHYLTQRQTLSQEGWNNYVSYFNSLPHAEVDRCPTFSFSRSVHFNSLPHAEVDCCAAFCDPLCRISTHYLTQRQTIFVVIHFLHFQYFNSLPHAEVDKTF